MTRREASEMLERMLEDKNLGWGFGTRQELGLRLAKQALDILATLEEHLHLREPVEIEKHAALVGAPTWRVTRDRRTHLGSDLTDALGQLCQTLAMENDE